MFHNIYTFLDYPGICDGVQDFFTNAFNGASSRNCQNSLSQIRSIEINGFFPLKRCSALRNSCPKNVDVDRMEFGKDHLMSTESSHARCFPCKVQVTDHLLFSVQCYHKLYGFWRTGRCGIVFPERRKAINWPLVPLRPWRGSNSHRLTVKVFRQSSCGFLALAYCSSVVRLTLLPSRYFSIS